MTMSSLRTFTSRMDLQKLDWQYTASTTVPLDVAKIEDGFRWGFYELSLPNEIILDWNASRADSHPKSYSTGKAVNHVRMNEALPENFFVEGDAGLRISINQRLST